ncbi:hypothetical protein J6590_016900 [Homalodisca vitripennis]|nr:hypothetical protein J6590_016900 [Homalodisca vitripennis]
MSLWPYTPSRADKRPKLMDKDYIRYKDNQIAICGFQLYNSVYVAVHRYNSDIWFSGAREASDQPQPGSQVKRFLGHRLPEVHSPTPVPPQSRRWSVSLAVEWCDLICIRPRSIRETNLE